MFSKAMETLLNRVWLLLALTSTTLWVVYWRQAVFAPSRRKQILYSAVGLICVLVLMFYAISLTDDLQQITALVEDAALAGARSCKATVAHVRVPHPPPVHGIPPASLGLIIPHWLGILVQIDRAGADYIRPLHVASLRAPPSISA
jgi:hypothetical protein